MDQRLHHDYVRFMIGLAEYEARLEAEREARMAGVGRTPDVTPAGVVRRTVGPADARIDPPLPGVDTATRSPRPASASSRRSTG